MSIVAVPYHLDEYLPDLNLPLRADDGRTVVTAELPPGDTWGRLAVLYAKVAEAVAHEAGLITVLSGDCATALGTVAGLQRAGMSPGIIWFDAHGDVRTPETTPSGYLAGMAARLPPLRAWRTSSLLAGDGQWCISRATSRCLEAARDSLTDGCA